MTKYQGLPVSGYHPQSQENIELVNRNKRIEEDILRLLDAMKANTSFDQRWLAIGRTHLEEGFMAINRAIFRPDRVKLVDDND